MRTRGDYERAIRLVREVVHRWDPYGLLAGGCPADEFDREIEQARPELFGFLRDAWRFDSMFTRRIVQPIVLTAFIVAVVIDQFLVDGIVNGTAAAARAAPRYRRAR